MAPAVSCRACRRRPASPSARWCAVDRRAARRRAPARAGDEAAALAAAIVRRWPSSCDCRHGRRRRGRHTGIPDRHAGGRRRCAEPASRHRRRTPRPMLRGAQALDARSPATRPRTRTYFRARASRFARHRATGCCGILPAKTAHAAPPPGAILCAEDIAPRASWRPTGAGGGIALKAGSPPATSPCWPRRAACRWWSGWAAAGIDGHRGRPLLDGAAGSLVRRPRRRETARRSARGNGRRRRRSRWARPAAPTGADGWRRGMPSWSTSPIRPNSTGSIGASATASA